MCVCARTGAGVLYLPYRPIMRSEQHAVVVEFSGILVNIIFIMGHLIHLRLSLLCFFFFFFWFCFARSPALFSIGPSIWIVNKCGHVCLRLSASARFAACMCARVGLFVHACVLCGWLCVRVWRYAIWDFVIGRCLHLIAAFLFYFILFFFSFSLFFSISHFSYNI